MSMKPVAVLCGTALWKKYGMYDCVLLRSCNSCEGSLFNHYFYLKPERGYRHDWYVQGGLILFLNAHACVKPDLVRSDKRLRDPLGEN